MEPTDHLFRREYGRMVATMMRLLGVGNLALAEDVVQDAFCRALEVWKFRGIPENPSAWLMAAAKNRAFDLLRRDRTVRTREPELAKVFQNRRTLASAFEELFSESAIQSDQLRMMFSCCHPRLPEQAQVSLILNILCGFSVNEVANAFVSSHAAVEKRITRAKKILAGSKRLFEITETEVAARLSAVHHALYLLFNEGYHGASGESVIRSELCYEAMRLTALLLEHPTSARPATYALAALMCLGAARLPSRLNGTGNLLSLLEQDRSLWDQQLIDEGLKLLEFSGTGYELTEYHIEAAIASVHAAAPRIEETDWNQIVSLYDQLNAIRPTPVVALNRAIAIGQCQGPESGLCAIGAIPDSKRLAKYPFFYAALGEFDLRRGARESARQHFEAALALARNQTEHRFLAGRLRLCDQTDVRL
jgi:RNA polymerase sigma factor (sigma-70 family)